MHLNALTFDILFKQLTLMTEFLKNKSIGFLHLKILFWHLKEK